MPIVTLDMLYYCIDAVKLALIPDADVHLYLFSRNSCLLAMAHTLPTSLKILYRICMSAYFFLSIPPRPQHTGLVR